jgi:hypothetical protein
MRLWLPGRWPCYARAGLADRVTPPVTGDDAARRVLIDRIRKCMW